jgi:uncharacterized protein (TIGR03435 family)
MLTISLFATIAFSQAISLKFMAADVHKTPKTSALTMRGVLRKSGRYELYNATMLDFIRTAYNVDTNAIVSGPNWLEFDRFDMIARVPSNTPSKDLSLMLQSLLADRFGLVVHHDTKPVARLVLVKAKGTPKLKQAVAANTTGCRTQSGLLHVNGGQASFDPTIMTCHNVTMPEFASLLQGVASGYLASPVIDLTGLSGSWDFDLMWMPKGALSVVPDGVTIFDAVDKQLGLKLQEQEVSMPVLVVDSANQTPTANVADIATLLPALPSEFEVTDIKPVAPGASSSRGPMTFSASGHLSAPALPLRYAILLGWNLSSSEQIGDAPSWLNATQPQFDMNVQIPTGALLENDKPIPLEDLAPMLKTMLRDRFKMTSHFDDKLATTYTLVSDRPKLKRADPSRRTKCEVEDVPRRANRGSRPVFDRNVTCQNLTMGQFAEELPIISTYADTPYLAFPVLDGTHLDGTWDFTFTFNPAPQNSRPDTSPNNTTLDSGGLVASDPTGLTSLFDALDKQLGLQLKAGKRAYPVLMIDHLEATPSPN